MYVLMINLWTRSFFFASNLCVQWPIGCLHLDGLDIFGSIYIKFNYYLPSHIWSFPAYSVLLNTTTMFLVTQSKDLDTILDLFSPYRPHLLIYQILLCLSISSLYTTLTILIGAASISVHILWYFQSQSFILIQSVCFSAFLLKWCL